MAGQVLADLPLRDLLDGSGAEVLVGEVIGIDLVGCEVRVTTEVGERMLGYDTLVYGLGSVAGCGECVRCG